MPIVLSTSVGRLSAGTGPAPLPLHQVSVEGKSALSLTGWVRDEGENALSLSVRVSDEGERALSLSGWVRDGEESRNISYRLSAFWG